MSPSAVLQVPEEEILGTVYLNKAQIGAGGSEYIVTLTEVSGTGACIYRANNRSACLGTQTLQVMPWGSRPNKNTSIMWGWFDSLDSELTNPCRPGVGDIGEWHDLNGDDIRNDGTVEQHCIKLGRYTASISQNGGGSLRTRTVDHFATTSTTNTIHGKVIEDPTGPSSQDTYLHFDVGNTATHGVSNNNLLIDNPATSTQFAPGDTVVAPGVRVRFESTASTSWSGGPSIGKLMFRVYYNRSIDLSDRSEYWNPDAVVRSKAYGFNNSYQTRVEIATAKDATDATNRLSNQRTILVQTAPTPVASVQVSPSSASISIGAPVQLSATLRDLNGNILTGRPISWTSDNASIASVQGNGSSATVTGQGVGSTTIRATSEGVTGTASIQVQGGGTNDAAAAGNTLPSSFENGSTVSVTVTMQNSGSSTWTSAGSYALDLSRDVNFWAVGSEFVTSSVPPGASRVFALDLRMDDPSRRGMTACFFRMQQSQVFFGAENGWDINVTGPKILNGSDAGLLSGESGTVVDDANPMAWLSGATSLPATPLSLGSTVPAATDDVVFGYRYSHAVPRDLDVVFEFSFDPSIVEILPPSIGSGGDGLIVKAGFGEDGRYWVRLTGTVPRGEGEIADFGFRLKPGHSWPDQVGTLRLHYPKP